MSENRKDQQRNDSLDQDRYQDSNSDRQNSSANRGGTTDMDDEALTSGRGTGQQRGSGISTKNAVTGSDYDGQLSQE